MTLRFGLVGTGYWATEVHATGLLAHPGAQLWGVWGRNPETTRLTADELGIVACSSPEELFAQVDAVAFAVPPDAQAPLAVQAAAAGCHLLLEKPVATRVGDADRIVAAADASGVSGIVFLTRRFVPDTAAWLRETGAQGGWYGGHLEWVGTLAAPGSPFAESAWRYERGALWDGGPHALSLVLAVLGAVEAVTARPGPGDTTHLVLRHAGGASSTATMSSTVPPPARNQLLQVYGSGGRSQSPVVRFDPVDCHRRAVSALLSAVETGRPHECDLRLGREITAVLAAAERSRATGVVDLAP